MFKRKAILSIILFLGLGSMTLSLVAGTGLNVLASTNSDAYAINFKQDKNKFVDGRDHEIVASGTANEVLTDERHNVDFRYDKVRSSVYYWQYLDANAMFENIDPINGISSLTINMVDKDNNDPELMVYYSFDSTFKEGKYVTLNETNPTTNFDGYAPNYIQVVNNHAKEVVVGSVKISFGCKNLYHYVEGVVNPEHGTVEGSGYGREGKSVHLMAFPNNGFAIEGWYENNVRIDEFKDDYGALIDVIDRDRTIEIRFIQIGYGVIANVNNKDLGFVSPQYDYRDQGLETTITAYPREIGTFVGWYQNDKLLSTDLSYTFIMPNHNFVVDAIFDYKEFMVNAVTDDPTLGSIKGSGKHKFGTSVTLTAVPKDGTTFYGWYDKETTIKLTDELSFTFNMPAKTLNYYAKFKAAFTVTLTSESPGSNIKGSGVYSYKDVVHCSVTYDQAKYLFKGWQNSLNEIVSELADFDIYVAMDYKLVARFELRTNIFEFGSYPQSRVTDSALIYKLKQHVGSPDNTWLKNYEYYVEYTDDGKHDHYFDIKDFVYEGKKYRAYKHFPRDDNSRYNKPYYDQNTVIFFEFEPLKWVCPGGGKFCYSLMCTDTGQRFFKGDPEWSQGRPVAPGSSKRYYAGDYYASDIRIFLNTSFYNTAFNEEEKKQIALTHVDNSRAQQPNIREEYDGYNWQDTEDYVYLLSYKELQDPKLYFDIAQNRVGIPTDYSKIYLSYGINYWTRTCGEFYNNWAGVSDSQGLYGRDNPPYPHLLVRPVITLN